MYPFPGDEERGLLGTLYFKEIGRHSGIERASLRPSARSIVRPRKAAVVHTGVHCSVSAAVRFSASVRSTGRDLHASHTGLHRRLRTST